jgi:RimJ/RimL family protein N-acetyltransferase
MAGYTIVWEFHVRPEHRAEFEEHYGPQGAWARLFRRAPEYVGTRLMKEHAAAAETYVTIDRWKDEAGSTTFREQYAREYQELDARCEPLTLRERYVTAFTENERGLLLDTPRLRLRQFDPGDAGFVLQLLNEPPFMHFIGDKGVRTLDDAREYIRKGPLDSYARLGFGMYLVSLKTNGAPVGMCGLVKREVLEDVDIGFAFLTQVHSQGYGFEAASAVLAHARYSLGMRRIAGVTRPDNHGSIRVLQKLGLELIGTVRIAQGGPEDQLFVREL